MRDSLRKLPFNSGSMAAARIKAPIPTSPVMVSSMAIPLTPPAPEGNQAGMEKVPIPEMV